MPTVTKRHRVKKTRRELEHWALRPRPKAFEFWKKRIARRIRVEALERGWSWSELARHAELNGATVRRFLDYETALPHAFTLWKLAHATGLTFELTSGGAS